MCSSNLKGYGENDQPIVENVKIKNLEYLTTENENYKNKYGRLLEKDNQQKLNEVVLNYETVDSILKQTQHGWPGFFDSTHFNKFKSEVTNLLKYTTGQLKKISKLRAFQLISAFQQETLSLDQIQQILDLVDEKLDTEFDTGNSEVVSWGFEVLKGQKASEKLIKFAIDCIEFERVGILKAEFALTKADLLDIICLFIIRDPYSNNNFKQAIKNVLIDGVEYEEFRKKLSQVKGFGEYVTDRLTQDNRYYRVVNQFQEKLSEANIDLCFKNGKFELKKMEPINVDVQKTEQKSNNTGKIVADASNDSDRKLLCLRFAYVILFIIAFVALLNVWLSFLAVPKIVSWIVFGICFSGGSVCVFFACRIKNLKNQEKKQINLVYPITQNNGYTMIYSDVDHVNSNINHDFYSGGYDRFDN